MRSLYDLQALAYLAAYIGLFIYLWVSGFAWWAYLSLLFFVVGVQVIHHNHVHLGIWHSKILNRLTSLLISVTTAVPTAMMYGGHIKNHHTHQHGPEDHTRTYRFGGDHNHLLGYLLHPFQAFAVLIPIFWDDYKKGWANGSRFTKDMSLQVALIFLLWVVLASFDWQKFLLLVLAPQLIGLHWLLGSNYFQHAHCDDASDVNYARNFTGAVNWIWFNIGFHTAHHDHPRVHWSELRKVHAESCQDVHPSLNCPSFVVYVVKTLILGSFVPAFRSKSLRATGGA